MEDRSLVKSTIPVPELYFLIAKFLSNGPLQEAGKVLVQELEKLDLFPRRLDWTGQEHRQTLAEVERKYPHIGPQHLLEICSRVGPLLDKELPPAISGVLTALGAGRQSLLRTKESVSRPRQLVDYYTRLHDRPLSDVVNRNNTQNLVRVLYGRESAGPLLRRQAIPPSFYAKQTLQRRTLGHLSAVYCVLFDRTGKYIITGADDFLVKLWSAIDGRLLATFRGASAEITDIAINLDNTMLAAGSLDRILRVWDLQYGGPIAVLSGHTGMITSVNFCPSPKTDLRYLVTTSTDGSVAFWEYSTRGGKTTFCSKPTSYHEKIRPGQAQMICGSFSPGGIFLAAGSADHHVRVYLMSEDGPKRILETESHGDTVDSIQWAHAGLRFVSGSKDGTALVWHFESQQWKSVRLNMADRLPSCPPVNPDDNVKLKVTMVSWDNTDKWVITAVNDHTIKVWNSHNGRLHRVLRGHTKEIYVLESHQTDSGVLLSAGHDGHLFIWDIVAGVSIASFVNRINDAWESGIYDAKWSPDGMMIAATDSDGHILMFGYGAGHEKLKQLPLELFFHTDYRPLIRDSALHVMDEQTQTMPHLMPPPFLVDIDGNPYPPALQRLVPGRENCPTDQLIPNITVGNGGGVGIEQQPQPQQPQQQPADPLAAGGAYSNIDRLIEALANRQGAGAVAGAVRGEEENREQPAPQALVGANERRRTNSVGSGQGSARNGPAGAGRNAAAAGPQQAPRLGSAGGNWNAQAGAAAAAAAEQDTAGYKFHRRQYVRPMSYSSMLSLKQRVYAAGVQEQEVYRREMRRRPVMINTANNASSSLGHAMNGGPSGSRRAGGRGGAGNRAVRRAAAAAAAAGDAAPAGGPAPAYRTRAVRENEPRPEPEEDDDDHEAEEQNDSSSSEPSNSDDDSTAIEEELDLSGSSTSDSQSSDYSDWVAHEPGRNLEPPKRSKRKHVQRRAYSPPDPDQPGPSNSGAATAAAPGSSGSGQGGRRSTKVRKIPLTRDGEIPEQFRPPEWLSEVIPRKAPYYPQMGDEVVYFRQGHQRYLEAVRTKAVYALGNRSEPWASMEIQEHELCKVIGIKYEIRPPRLCCLKLAIITEDGELTGRSFAIKYHDMPDVLDFLVLRQTFDTSVGRNWGPGDRFRCMIEDVWWTGAIESRNQLSPDFPDSHFMCFRVRWDNGEYELMSPWDLEPVDESRQPEEVGGAVPVLPEELQATLYQPKAEEWPRGDRDGSCRRIIAGLEQVMGLAIADLFLAPVDLNLYPEYAFVVEYPIDLNTIKSRFENRFYRRVTSAQFDVRYLATNAEKFNESHSTIVRNARIITDLCLRILSDLNEIDVPAVYHQLVDTYLSSDSETEAHRRAAGPSSSSTRGGGADGAGPSGLSGSAGTASARRAPAGGSRRSRRLVPEGDWRVDCRELLEMIWQCDDSEPFREPVDTIEHPDYLQIIDTPMDLRTIKEDLLGGNYETPLDFYKDMKLIFQNSRNYNTNKRSRIYSMTLRLSTLFEAHIKPIIYVWKSARRRGKAAVRGKRSAGGATAGGSGAPSAAGGSSRSGGWYGEEPGAGPSGTNGLSSSSVGAHSSKRRRLAERRRRVHDDDDDDDDDDDEDDGPGPSSSSGRRQRGSQAATLGLNSSGGSSRTAASRPDDEEDDDDDDEDDEDVTDSRRTAISKRSRNGGTMVTGRRRGRPPSNGVSSSSQNVIDPSGSQRGIARSRARTLRGRRALEEDEEDEEEAAVGTESDASTSDDTTTDDSDSDDDDDEDDDSTGVPVSHRADYDSGEMYDPYKRRKRRPAANPSSARKRKKKKEKKKVHRSRRQVSSTTKRKNGVSATGGASTSGAPSRSSVRQDLFGVTSASTGAGSSRALRNGAIGADRSPPSSSSLPIDRDGSKPKQQANNKRPRRLARNQMASSDDDDDDDDEDDDDDDREAAEEGGAGPPPSKRSRGRYESDHSYHKERPKTSRIVSDTDNDEAEPPRSTRGSVRRAQAEWGKSEDSLEGPPNDDEDDDDDDDDDDNDNDGTTAAASASRSRRIMDEEDEPGPSSGRAVGASSSTIRSAGTTASTSDRQMRTRKPIVMSSDHDEHSPEETANISKRGSASYHSSSRSSRRQFAVETTATERNGDVAGPGPSGLRGRRLRGAGMLADGVVPSTSSAATPPPHTVDHNYGEPGPSSSASMSGTVASSSSRGSRVVVSTSASNAVTGTMVSGGTAATTAAAVLRRTRNRSSTTMLSRHQRNADELDQTTVVMEQQEHLSSSSLLVRSEEPSTHTRRGNHLLQRRNHRHDDDDDHADDDHDDDDDDDEDDEDDVPLRAAPGLRQLRSRRPVSSKRRTKRVSSSHDEQHELEGGEHDGDEQEDEGGEGHDDDGTSDSDDDNTPLHVMAAAAAATAAAATRTRGSRSQTVAATGTATTNRGMRGTPKKSQTSESQATVAPGSASRARRKERYTSDEEYELPGPSSGRSTRKLKRLRYNEQSEEEEGANGADQAQQQGQHRRHHRLGSSSSANHRSMRRGGNPATMRRRQQRRHHHDDDDDDDDAENDDIQRALENIRQRSRRQPVSAAGAETTNSSTTQQHSYGSTLNSPSISVVDQRPATQRPQRQQPPPSLQPQQSLQQQQLQQHHQSPYHPPSRHQSFGNSSNPVHDTDAADRPTTNGDDDDDGGGDRGVGSGLQRRQRHRHPMVYDDTFGSNPVDGARSSSNSSRHLSNRFSAFHSAHSVLQRQPSEHRPHVRATSARALRARERDQQQQQQPGRVHRQRNGNASAVTDDDDDEDEDEVEDGDDDAQQLTSVSSRGRVRRINPRVRRIFGE